MGTIAKRSAGQLVRHENGRYYIHYADPTGRSRQLSTRTDSAKLAKQRLEDFRAQRPVSTTEPSIEQILDHYLADRKDSVASYDAIKFASRNLKRHIGHHKPSNLTRMIGRGYHQSRRKDGVKDGTIIREIVTLRAALRTAKHDKMYSCDVPHVEAPAAPPPRERWLTKDEATALLDAAVSPHIQLFIMLALDTGARKGAIFDLTWDRVSDDYSRINYTLPGRPTSNKRRAIVATTKRVRQALKNAQQLAQTDHVIEYNGKRVHNIQNAWGKTLKKSGIDHITIHGLRHTCATWLVMSGMVKHDKIARMLGTTKEMIDKVYGHHSPHYLSDAVSVLENH